ncbi:MAG: DoxX family protein [Planctomycetota bacterium]
MFRDLLFPAAPGARASLGLLTIRVVAGAAFMFHGGPKLSHPTEWMGSDIPGMIQAATVIAEFGGGALWILGLLTPLASLAIGCTMALQASKHIGHGDAFATIKSASQDSEKALLYLAIAVLLLLIGPGKFAVDQYFFRKKEEE